MPDINLDQIIADLEALAQRAVDELKNNPKVQQVQQKFEEVKAALEDVRSDQPDDEGSTAQGGPVPADTPDE
jgi:hypothetical protein